MFSSSRKADLLNWLDGMMRLVRESCATIAPKAFLPSLPLALSPQSGSTMVRVSTAPMRVWKRSAPSRKKGRFSGNDSANWVLTVSCAASASIWEKSGLTAALSVRLGVGLQRPEMPGSKSSSVSKSSLALRTAVWLPTTVGASSRLSPGVMPSTPTSFAVWQR